MKRVPGVAVFGVGPNAHFITLGACIVENNYATLVQRVQCDVQPVGRRRLIDRSINTG